MTVEGGDPVAAAQRFTAEGASWLHVVDLDGAFSGAPDLGLVSRIAAVGLPVQVGGGYRTLTSIEAALAAGAARVLVGTAALEDEFLSAAASRFGDGVIVAIDSRQGTVRVNGWTRSAELTPPELAGKCARRRHPPGSGHEHAARRNALRPGRPAPGERPRSGPAGDRGGRDCSARRSQAAPRARLRGCGHRQCDLARPLHACRSGRPGGRSCIK